METKPPELEEFEERRCPGCGEELSQDKDRGPVCQRCHEQLDRELRAYLSFVAVTRE